MSKSVKYKEAIITGIIIAVFFFLGSIGIKAGPIYKLAAASNINTLFIIFPIGFGIFTGIVEGIRTKLSNYKQNTLNSILAIAVVFLSYALGVCYWGYQDEGLHAINSVSSFFLAGSGGFVINIIIKDSIIKLRHHA